MTSYERQLLCEIEAMIGCADALKIRAERLRKKLERINAPASRQRGKVAKEVIAHVIDMRNKRITKNKKAMREHGNS